MNPRILPFLVLLATFCAPAPCWASPGNEAVSDIFAFDTRDSVGTVAGESGTFALTAWDIDGFDAVGSGGFTLDTQGSAGGSTLLVLGTVRDTAGTTLEGASVEIRRFGTVFWSGTTDGAGIYASTPLAEGSYTVIAGHPGHADGIRNVSGSGGWVVGFALEPLPVPPVLADEDREIPPSASRPAGGSGILKAFQAGSFGTAPGTLDPALPTVVISHGWNSSPDDFVTDLAAAIVAGAAQPVNIVTWDWRGRAAAVAPPIDAACEEGVAFGKALHAALGSGYARPVHFIGHSLGTIVNRYACDSLHGDLRAIGDNAFPAWNAGATTPHITLLDEAEIASVLGENVTTSALLGWKIANLKGALLAGTLAAQLTWKDPVPESAVWLDNYISAVGFSRDEAVNVALLKPSTTLTVADFWDDVEAAHGYAHQWYRATAEDTASGNGFQWAGVSGASFPPGGTGFSPGDQWYENLDTAAPWDVSPSRPDMGAYGWQYDAWEAAFDGSFPVLFGAGVLAQDTANDAVTWMGGQIVGGVRKVGDVAADVAEKTGYFIDATSDAAVDFISSIDPSATIPGPINSPVLRFILRTPEDPEAFLSGGDVSYLNGPAEEPGIWVDVAIPPDAAFLAFDFTVTGDAAQDRIACAINDQNIFTLAARFAEPGQVTSTDLMDISAHAGQTVELFFGLVGGTSSGCEVAIDGIRFQRLTPPKLAISSQGGDIRVGWPVTATGWTLQSSPDLSPDSWTPHPLDSAVIQDGQGVLEGPPAAPRGFFRLRRAGE